MLKFILRKDGRVQPDWFVAKDHTGSVLKSTGSRQVVLEAALDSLGYELVEAGRQRGLARGVHRAGDRRGRRVGGE